MSNTTATKPKKPIYKRVWFWLLVIVAVIVIAAATGNDTDTDGATGAASSTGGTEQPATEQPATTDDPLSDDGWTASDIRVDAQSVGTMIGARILNTEDAARSGVFTLTVFSGGKVIATGSGAANDVEGGSAASVNFLTTADLQGVDPATMTFELQNDF